MTYTLWDKRQNSYGDEAPGHCSYCPPLRLPELVLNSDESRLKFRYCGLCLSQINARTQWRSIKTEFTAPPREYTVYVLPHPLNEFSYFGFQRSKCVVQCLFLLTRTTEQLSELLISHSAFSCHTLDLIFIAKTMIEAENSIKMSFSIALLPDEE